MVAGHFTEDELERTAIGWLQELGYDCRFGPDIAPDGSAPERAAYSDVLLLDRLREALTDLNPDLPSYAIDEAVQKLQRVEHPDLLWGGGEMGTQEPSVAIEKTPSFLRQYPAYQRRASALTPTVSAMIRVNIFGNQA